MLLELSVENLAIIERASVSLGSGFTALTGETGAGKSLLVDAIQLVLGVRADSSLVRHDCPRALVSAAFDLSGRPDLIELCESLGVSLENDILYVVREVAAEGKSQCRIGGKLSPLSVLKEIGDALVDFHGQHEHQSLLHSSRHVEFLDIFANTQTELLAVQKAYAAAASSKSRLQSLEDGLREREYRIDLLNYQIHEIEAISPTLGETEATELRIARLRHFEKLLEAVRTCMNQLQGGDHPAFDQVGLSVRSLEAALKLDESLGEILEPLHIALANIAEANTRLEAYASGLEADPETLTEFIDRLDSLRRLHRKYGGSDEAVISYLEAARTELDELARGEESREALQSEVASTQSCLMEACQRLTTLRSQAAQGFAQRVRRQLVDLAMTSAQFEVQIEPDEPSSTGADRVEFLFSANEGEPLAPLARIASGGEISRVMLAIKVALARPTGAPCVVFDEVDAGLGGKAAAVVAEKLDELSQHCQVLAISHLAQIAGRATSHFRVEKQTSHGRTTANVNALNQEQRVVELARMLAGNTSETAMIHAREILSGSSQN